jgi:hypothetical protein
MPPYAAASGAIGGPSTYRFALRFAALAQQIRLSIERSGSGANNQRLRKGKELTLKPYLHIGGDKDGLSYPVPDGAGTVTLPVAVTDKGTYIRSTLSVGDVSITIYIHESLTPTEALSRIVESYKALAVNRPGGRR